MKNLLLTCFVLFSSSIAVGQSFEIYVSDAGSFSTPPWKILKFDENGNNPEVFINKNLAWPQDILFLEDSNTVLISNLNSGRITRYNAETGDYIDNFAEGIGGPTRMKIGADNHLYVLQWNGNGKVLRYDLNGTLIGAFTDFGVPDSIGMDWDNSGNFYVASFSDKSVRKFDSTGQNLGLFIITNLSGPTNIWFDNSGDLLVSDYSGNAIKRFAANGSYKGAYISGLSQSEGVDFFPNGDVLIGNGGTSSVKLYNSNGVFKKDLIPGQSGGLKTPNAVVIREAVTKVGLPINAGLNGNWWNGPERSGEGVQIEVSAGAGGSLVLVATVYSYDTLGNQIFMITVGNVNDDTSEVDVYITEGGLWGEDFDPALVKETQWGTGMFLASSCAAMHMELQPNAEYQGKGYTNLNYDLVRLTTPAAPCPI